MKKLLTTIISITILMSIMISPASAELKDGYIDHGSYRDEFKYEDIGDFRYIYRYGGSILEVLYKKRSSKQEIKRIEFPAEHNGKQVDVIGFTNDNHDENLKVNTIFIPKTIDVFSISCVYDPFDDESGERLVSVKNIEVDKDNPYLCSKDGVLYSKDMKILYLYPNRNNMTVYKMPNTIEDTFYYRYLFKRNNLRKVYLSDNLKKIDLSSLQNCKNLEYVYIGTNTKEIGESAFCSDEKLKTVKIKSKKLKTIGESSFNGCSSLKNINIPSTLKIIEGSAFRDCKSLKKIKLPKNLKKIGSFAFMDCKKLSKVIISNTNKAPEIKNKVYCYYNYKKNKKVYQKTFSGTKKGIKFHVKNKKVAKSLKKQLKGSGVKNAKILIGKKVVYQNING